MKHTFCFAFIPGAWVVITFCGVNYNGRVSKCARAFGGNEYTVEYVNDTGDFKEGVFQEDELAERDLYSSRQTAPIGLGAN